MKITVLMSFPFHSAQSWKIWQNVEKKLLMGIWNAGGGSGTSKANIEMGEVTFQKAPGTYFGEIREAWK